MNPNNWEARRQERWARRQERWERRRAGCGSNPFSGVIFGLLLIGGGLLYLLNNLDIIHVREIGRYWPVFPLALGISRLISARHSGDVISGVWLSGFGGLFLLQTFNIVPNVWRLFWPAMLIIGGLAMLLRNLYGPDWFHGGPPPGTPGPQTASPGATPEDARFEHVSLIFGATDRRNISQDFEGGRISVVFGEANVDLTGVASTRPEVLVNADVVFGAINLRVPANWEVDVRGSGVFGAYENQTHRPTTAATKVIVRGGAVFGGVTVRN